MKKVKHQELVQKPKKELTEMLANLKHEILDLRMKTEGSSLKNVKSIREKRKDIARILTVINNS